MGKICRMNESPRGEGKKLMCSEGKIEENLANGDQGTNLNGTLQI